MIVLAATALLFQQTQISVEVDSKKGTSVKVIAHGGGADSTRPARKAVVATPQQIASAFHDDGARSLLAKARAARVGQDSSIQSYEASTVQRLTVGMGFSKIGRDRIFFRHEAAARVRWARGVGAQIDVTGKRTAVPMLGGKTEVDIESVLSPVPYYPGRDALWFGLSRAVSTVAEDDVIHPLANGAEAFYTYRSGDSISFHLPDGTTVQLRELEVLPRVPEWRTIVASLWFDTRSGQLVRAAYRMAQPFNFLTDDDGEKPGFLTRAILRPANGTASGVAIEYGLYQGRFWLPRSQVLEANVTVGVARMPMRMEEHFTYAGVNGADSLPLLPPVDTAAVRRNRLDPRRDSVAAARYAAECATNGEHTMRTSRYNGTLPVIVHVPCDTAKLAHSPALPPSIFAAGEEVFGDAERDALLAKAEQMMPPMPVTLRPPKVGWGFDLLRYNRVEGLSSALDITQQLGAYSLSLVPRIGTADRIPNAELSISRSNGLGTTAALTGYRRLAVANDWGHPLDFGSGASALLFGRDEGFYYRATGAELTGDLLFGRPWSWRVFHELESDAVARTNVSLPRAFGSDGFDPAWNIAANRIRETGASLRNVSSFGLDPNGFRLLSDVRVEGAGGDLSYGRGAMDVTLSHPLGRALRRDFAGSVTVGAGTTVGDAPIQRLWYLGGTNTVRGQAAGAMAGDSYWLTRSEIGYGSPGLRRVAFFDLGWAGSRSSWNTMGRPASGAGIGFSLLDGLIRADIARGIFPEKNWRSALYLEAKF